eukprot:CAMPEP_0119115878 /NCGR_PEP_ID=MMETSP1180-20130426/51981_1 /TAXON_ID=3052 ORGANISM="Chlamydomonas cf sp, Strain CCMP681" /NCGR_SAMPLE_ID=MMETSP1180 /ASSEMBLY_ACC=CAM_ASM_000741 /LENGTH=283 /DNA_ID=CAMNT_0007104981 /DNA_START=26 /DNA_END=877 /DNA_ORIENTATION=+
MRLASTPLVSWAASLHRLAQTSCGGKLWADHRALSQLNSIKAEYATEALSPKQPSPRSLALQALDLKMGDIVQATVKEVYVSPRAIGLHLDVRGVRANLTTSNISHAPLNLEDMNKIFKTGDTIKALVQRVALARSQLTLSTKRLESTPGDMLRDPQMVYAGAEEKGAAFRLQGAQERALRFPQMVYAGAEEKGAAFRLQGAQERALRLQGFKASGIKAGDVLQGTVKCCFQKGVYVTVCPGVDGFLSHPSGSTQCKLGDTIQVKVESCDMVTANVRLTKLDA